MRIFAAGVILFLALAQMPAIVERNVATSKRILGAATSGLDSLQKGELESAYKSLESAKEELQKSQEIFIDIVGYLPQGRDLEGALIAGAHVSKAINLLLSAASEFQDLRLEWDMRTNSSSQTFYEGLKKSRQTLYESGFELSMAAALTNGINPSIFSKAYQDKFQKARAQLEFAQAALQDLDNAQSLLLGLLGGKNKTYLLIFQNNAEMRATGGFIGTYGLLKFENGTARIDRIESIYALDGQLKREIAAPGPLRRQATQTWGLRDANWFADFPTSARKILEFLEIEGGIFADGVIALTPDVFEQILDLVGPVEMPEYGETLTSENFRNVVQRKTSLEYDRAQNQPKKFLADFAPRLLARIKTLDQENWVRLGGVMSNAVSQKHLMAFSLDQALQNNILLLHADGGIKNTSQDYMAVYHSSVGGGKTDHQIRQRIEKRVSVDSGGLAIVRLRLERTHEGYEEKFFPKNLDFMRILVPRQAKLLSARGFDSAELLPSSLDGAISDSDLSLWDEKISYDEKTGMYLGQEAGYAFFANWQELEPGESKTVELVYELQLATASTYTQLVQKQPGAKPFDFSLEIKYLPGNISYFYPKHFAKDGDALTISESVNSDKFYAVIGQ